jgi:hypothetical protein
MNSYAGAPATVRPEALELVGVIQVDITWTISPQSQQPA